MKGHYKCIVINMKKILTLIALTITFPIWIVPISILVIIYLYMDTNPQNYWRNSHY